MSTLDDDSGPNNDENDDTPTYGALRKNQEIALIFSRIEDLRQNNRLEYFCVGFPDDAELFFPHDSDEYIRKMLEKRKRDDLAASEVIQGWPQETTVFRNALELEGSPTTAEKAYLSDNRFKNVQSLRELLSLCSEHRQEADMEAKIFTLILRERAQDGPPDLHLIRLLTEALRMGELDSVVNVAERFLSQEKAGKYEEYYHNALHPVLLQGIIEDRQARKNAFKFMDATGVHPQSITSLHELERVTGEGNPGLQDTLFCQYLRSLDQGIPNGILAKIVFPLLRSKKRVFASEAEKTLWRLDFFDQDGKCTQDF